MSYAVCLVLATALGAVVAPYVPPGPLYPCPEKTSLLYPCRCVAGTDLGVRILCENSNLAAISVGLSNLASLRVPVEELTFSRCNIGRLYGNLLYKLHVRVLNIMDTPIKSIDAYTFQGVNRTLQELHIVQTKLQTFPSEAFQLLGNLTVLHIDGHELSSLPANSFSGGLLPNRLERLHLTNGKITELPTDVFLQLRKLKKLDLHGNAISQLKKNQFKGLRDVVLLDLSHNHITKIETPQIVDLNKMVWCNLSHNAMTDLPRGTFARNNALSVLNMSNNKLKQLDANTFRGIKLRRLYMSDNNLTTIGRGTFASLSHVATINLARNHIKKIDFQMFSGLRYLEDVDVSENEIKEIEKLAFKEMYQTSINLSHNVIEKIEAGAFEQCSNFSIDLSHNKLSKIPKAAFDEISSAYIINVAYNKFSNISQIPLQNMTGLKILNASFNELESISRNTFPKLYELHTIDLSHNKISDIWNSVFQTLFSLRFLNLSYNSLEDIKGSTFGSLTTLLELDLSYNNISNVNKAALAKLSSCRNLILHHNNISKLFQIPISLSHLDLSYNSIENIVPHNTWPVMNALLSINLSNNKLKDSLEKGSFANLLTLQKVDLSYNEISKPPWESLSDLTTLQYIHLHHNDLTQLARGAFGRLPVVFQLDLSANKIWNVSSLAFEGLLQLLSLNLSSNGLTRIPNGAFQGLVSLRTLDLSFNALDKLDNKTHGLLDDCLSLQHVNLSHNKMSFITRKTFPSSPWVPYKLREIDLSFNQIPVITSELIYGTKELEVLNVSYNMLNEIRPGVLGNLTKLKILDISHNELPNFAPRSLGPPPNLTELYMSHNFLSRLPVDEIKTLLAKLRLIDARSNKIAEFPKDLLTMVKNGTKILFSGNPLKCNCFARPLHRWLTSQLDLDYDWTNISCSQPEFLAGKRFVDSDEDMMACGSTDLRSDDPDLDVTPDVKFRELKRLGNGISVTWFVSSHKDIADFHILLQKNGDHNGKNAEKILEKDIMYNERSQELQNIPSVSENMQLCLLARDSEGNVRKWRRNQCQVITGFATSSSQNIKSSQSVIITIISILSIHQIFH